VALTTCPDCGHYLSTKALLCPHCGCPRPSEGWPSTEAADPPVQKASTHRASVAKPGPEKASTRFRVTGRRGAAPNSQRSDGLAIIAILTAFIVLVMVFTAVGRIVGGIVLLCAGLIEWLSPNKGIARLIEFVERFRPGIRASVDRSILRTSTVRAIATAGLGICLLLIPLAATVLRSSTPSSTTRDSVSMAAPPATSPDVSTPPSGAAVSPQHQPEASPHVQSARPPAVSETPKLLPMGSALRGVHNPMKLCGRTVAEAPSVFCYQTGAKGTILCRTEESSFALEIALNNLRQNNIKVQTVTDAMAYGQLIKSNGCFTDDSSGILAATPDFAKMYILNGKSRGQVLYSRAPQWGWEICGDSTGRMNGACPVVAPPWPTRPAGGP
jgi:hypothetical protein